MITRLRVGLSHLRDYKFKHSFQDCLNPTCSRGTELETTAHYLLDCTNKLFRTTSNLSFLIFWNKVTVLLTMFFSLVIPFLMTLQIQLS